MLGLVSVEKCVDHTEFADLFENYKKVSLLLHLIEVLGLVSVGKCVDKTEFANLFENYKKVSMLLKVMNFTLSMRKLFVETKYDVSSIKHVNILKVYSF